MTRVELTEALGVNRSTIGALVSDLVDLGLVEEAAPSGAPSGRAGRPSLVVRLRTSSVVALAAHLSAETVEVALVGLGGEVLARRCERAAARDPAAAAASLALAAAALLPPGSPERAALSGAGVAVPGTVRSADGHVGHAPSLGWRDVPFGRLATEALCSGLGGPVPVEVGNEADAGVIAERLRGAAVGSDDVVYLCGTRGLGGGVVTGGRPLVGSRGYAGEVGHIGVTVDGRPCHCGSRGCWESESMAGAWAEALGLDAGAEDVVDRIEEQLLAGGIASRRARERISRDFARGLASVVNVVNPEVVVLGAGLWEQLWPLVEDDVMPWAQRFMIPALREGLSVRTTALGGDSTLLGAAEAALAALLEDPVRVSGRAAAV